MTISQTYNMDCLEYMKNIPDKRFDLAIVDLPYGINAPNMRMGEHAGYQSTASRIRTKAQKGRFNTGAGKLKNRALNTMSCDWDLNPPPQEYFNELFRVSKNQIIWGGNYFHLPPTRGIVVWDKEQPWDNFSQVEMAWTSFDCPAKLFRLGSRGVANTEEKIHPTQKPVELYAFLLRTFALPGDIILDTHLGSGSSRIAAFMLGFDFYATEIDSSYYEAQERRFHRTCLDEYETINGKIVKQLNLFEL